MNLAHVYPHQRPPKRGSRPRARSRRRCAAAASRARSDKTSRRPSSGRRVLLGGRRPYKRRRAARRRRLVVVLSARAWAVLVAEAPRRRRWRRRRRGHRGRRGRRGRQVRGRQGRARVEAGHGDGEAPGLARGGGGRGDLRGAPHVVAGEGVHFLFYHAPRRRKAPQAAIQFWPLRHAPGAFNAEQQAVAVLSDLLNPAESLQPRRWLAKRLRAKWLASVV